MSTLLFCEISPRWTMTFSPFFATYGFSWWLPELHLCIFMALVRCLHNILCALESVQSKIQKLM
jgi:hypothetical protein